VKTKIEWATHIWNPVIGCKHVSPGCDHCYAERMANRLSANPRSHYGVGPGLGKIAEGGKWTGEVRFMHSMLDGPANWRKPRRIFVGSMTDLFQPSVPVSFLQDLFETFDKYHRHSYLILTKRPGRLRGIAHRLKFPPNVWIGVSVEDTKRLKRLDTLREIPTPNRFVSFEPLLEEIKKPNMRDIKWAIIGGESGSKRRCHYSWIYDLALSCQRQRAKIFVKQLGEVEARFWECTDRKGGDPSEWPFSLREASKNQREFPEGMVQ
jgi:protein gp37